MVLDFYTYLFGALVAICGAVQYYSKYYAGSSSSSSSSGDGEGRKEGKDPEEIKKAEENEVVFKRFQFNYLLVYFIVMGKYNLFRFIENYFYSSYSSYSD